MNAVAEKPDLLDRLPWRADIAMQIQFARDSEASYTYGYRASNETHDARCRRRLMENLRYLTQYLDQKQYKTDKGRSTAETYIATSSVMLGYEVKTISTLIKNVDDAEERIAKHRAKLDTLAAPFQPTDQDWLDYLRDPQNLSRVMPKMLGKDSEASMCQCCGSGNYTRVLENDRIFFREDKVRPETTQKYYGAGFYDKYDEELVLKDEETGKTITIFWKNQ